MFSTDSGLRNITNPRSYDMITVELYFANRIVSLENRLYHLGNLEIATLLIFYIGILALGH